MKLLLDQNLSRRLKRSLKDAFAGIFHVSELGLERATDLEIWRFAAANDLCIVSKDKDFIQHAIVLGPPPKFLWIAAGNCSTNDVLRLLFSKHEIISKFFDDPERAVLVLH